MVCARAYIPLTAAVALHSGAPRGEALRASAPRGNRSRLCVTQEVTVLEAGTTAERQALTAGRNIYRLDLAKDECVSVVVEQRGIDHRCPGSPPGRQRDRRFPIGDETSGSRAG